jgi:hypothetical protein
MKTGQFRGAALGLRAEKLSPGEFFNRTTSSAQTKGAEKSVFFSLKNSS